jgi:hypothetical protein
MPEEDTSFNLSSAPNNEEAESSTDPEEDDLKG